MIRLALALALAVAAVASADPQADADRAFRAAAERAAVGDPGAIDAFEALGGEVPTTRWTDDAWLEASRLAERAGQLDRARIDLERVVAATTDDQLRRRARAALDRIAAITGAGRWNDVAAEHERLTSRVFGGGDPQAALRELEALVRAHPGYPRANAARLTIAKGWEQEGQAARAIAWLRDAASSGASEPGQASRLELVRTLIRAGQLDEAGTTVRELDHATLVDRAALGEVARMLSRAQWRAWLRRALWVELGILLGGAAIALRRDTGSWCRAARQLVRPPIEVVFLVPIALVLVVVAHTGNPLVARAVRSITVVGVVIAWLSGVLLEAARARHGKIRARRAIAQAVLAVLAVGSATYLAIDRGRMIDLVVETWRGGPAMR